jgi:hypothetical protein
MTTRTVTGKLLDGKAQPRAGVKGLFRLESFSYDALATVPVDGEVPFESGSDGTYSVDLAADLATRWVYSCPGTPGFMFVLPAGDPISIEELRAVSGIPPVLTNAVQTALDAGFAAFSDELQEIAATTVGASAYEIAVLDGFVGTEAEWLDSLVGPQGEQGIQGAPGEDSTVPGPEGDPGPQGDPGPGVPTGGTYGQTVTKTDDADYATTWRDVPGIVYPSLLLSPDGSFDRNGVVSPTVVGTMTPTTGLYGQAWQGGAGRLTLPSGYLSHLAGTILIRAQTGTDNGADQRLLTHLAGGTPQRIYLGRLQSSLVPRLIFGDPQTIGDQTSAWADTTWGWMAARWQGSIATLLSHLSKTIFKANALTSTADFEIGAQGVSARWQGLIESVLIYPVALPDAEIARLSAMPAAWTMANAAANTLIPNTFNPNRQIAVGGATLRNAPPTTSDTIKTLAAATLVEDTFERVTSSSVDYAAVIVGALRGWVPVSTLTTL